MSLDDLPGEIDEPQILIGSRSFRALDHDRTRLFRRERQPAVLARLTHTFEHVSKAVQPCQPQRLVGRSEGEGTGPRCREEAAIQKGADRFGNPSRLTRDPQMRRIEGLCEERAIAHEQQMTLFARAVRYVRRAEARCEQPGRRGRPWRRVECVHVKRGVLRRGSRHAQIEEPPTVWEKPRKKMRRLLSRRIRLRHDGRLTARRRTADDATLRATDHDNAVLTPRAADGCGHGTHGLWTAPAHVNLLQLSNGVECNKPTVG